MYPNPKDIYSLIGFALVYLQSVEKNIRFCATYVLQGDAELTWEKLQRIKGQEKKKALGYFLGKITERAQLFPAFDSLLAEFLTNRNDLIHNQDKIPGWNLDTDEGILAARTFVFSFIRQAHAVNEIFAAIMRKWQIQANIETPVAPEAEEYLNQIDGRYGHLINILFTAKP
jgi:hypothetical protein